MYTYVPEKMMPYAFQNGKARIKKLFGKIPSVIMFFRRAKELRRKLLSWDNTWVTLGLWFYWTFLTLLCPLPVTPLFTLLPLIGLCIGASRRRTFAVAPHESPFVDDTEGKRSEENSLLFWNEYIDTDPEIPSTLPKKIRQLMRLALITQKLLLRVASFAERFQNMFSFEDATVSSVMLVTAVCIAVAMCAFIFAIECTLTMLSPYMVLVVVPRYLAFCMGTAKIFALHPLLRAQDSQGPGLKRRNANSDSASNEPKTLFSWLMNVCARIPDDTEATHRTIAAWQERPGDTEMRWYKPSSPTQKTKSL